MTYYRIAFRLAVTLLAVVLIGGLTLRAIDNTYGEPRCSQVTVHGAPYTPTSWEPVGWNIADGFEPLDCPVAGRWYIFWEDGSLSPR